MNVSVALPVAERTVDGNLIALPYAVLVVT
jgi:hypothetical protein